MDLGLKPMESAQNKIIIAAAIVLVVASAALVAPLVIAIARWLQESASSMQMLTH